jgi:integrase
MSKPLTAAAVAKFRPDSKRRRVLDAGMRSLFLVIEPSGHKAWEMRFRVSGARIGKMRLGPVDLNGTEIDGEPVVGMPLTLAAARQVAARIHRERALGHDPVAEHKAAKVRRRAAIVEATANRFAAVAAEYIQKHARTKIARWRERARLLGWQPTADGLTLIPHGLAERWADKLISQIDGHDIYTLIVEVQQHGAPGLERRSDHPTESRAHAMLATLSAMFGWLHRARRVESNPCAGVYRPKLPAARERVLSDKEIAIFWKAATEVTNAPVAAVLKLLLCTGARLSEIEKLRDDELVGDGSQINLPSNRTKNGRAHSIALPPLARDIVANVPRIDGCPFIFSTNGKTPVSIGSKIKRALDKAMGNPPHWRVHDLRRTCASGMQRLSIRAEVIERCLNHVSGSYRGVAGIYQRDPMLEETRAALERWAAHVIGLVSQQPENVVTMARKRRGGR